MRSPGTPRRPKALLQRLRPWILPLLAGALIVQMFVGGFDLAAVHEHFERGEVDAALGELARARPGDLAAELTVHGGFSWYPAAQRAADLATLRAMSPEERDESLDYPTFVSPLRRHREAPTRVRLREGLPQATEFELTSQQLGLAATRQRLEPDQAEFELETSLLNGSVYVMQLFEADTGLALPVLAAFELVGIQEALALSLAFDTATTHVAVDEPSEALVAAIVALNHGLIEESLAHLDGLLARAAYETVARELMALALVSAGLDVSALAVLDGAPRP